MKDVNGKVMAAIESALARGEVGMQVAAYVGEELVIDLWAGVADEQTGRKVDESTIFPVFSVTKAPAATALHIQADRGLVDYDAPVAKYWPEFAANGKGTATVRHALTHAVGIPMMPEGCTPEQMCDWDWMCRALAAMAPAWEPGTKHGYHAYTYGWLVGEVVRRTDPARRPFGQFVQDEICQPLGITALWMGIPDEVEPRVARLKNQAPPPPGSPPVQLPPLMSKAIPPDLGTNQETFGRPDVRRACIPAAGGIMDARSLARHYAMLANGGQLGGVRVLSEKRISIATELQSDAPDEVIPSGPRRALGYWLGGPTQPIIGSPRAFGHPGAGGSIGWCDPEAKLAVGIVKNRMGGATPTDNPVLDIANAVRDALGVGSA